MLNLLLVWPPNTCPYCSLYSSKWNDRTMIRLYLAASIKNMRVNTITAVIMWAANSDEHGNMGTSETLVVSKAQVFVLSFVQQWDFVSKNLSYTNQASSSWGRDECNWRYQYYKDSNSIRTSVAWDCILYSQYSEQKRCVLVIFNMHKANIIKVSVLF